LLLNENVINTKLDHIKGNINKSFEDMKNKHKDGKLIPADFNRVVHAIYKIPTDDLLYEVPNIFRIIRYALVIGVPFMINPALGLIGFIVDRVIEEKVNEKYAAQVINKFKRELISIDKKIENCKDKDERDALKDYRRALEDNKSKVERYYNELKGYKEKRKEAEERDREEAERLKEKENSNNDDDFADFGDFNFDESVINLINEKNLANEDLDKYIIKKFSESINEIIIVLEKHNLSEGIIRDTAKSVKNFDKRVSDRIDNKVNDHLYQKEKEKSQDIKKEILEGRVKISTVIKSAITVGTAAAINPAIAALGSIAYLIKKGIIKKKEKEKLLAELKEELEILEEKIKDAEQENDKKKKYEYLRLRIQLKRSIDKIRYNNTLRED